MDAGKDFSLRDFEKTLNPKTVRYLNAKTNQLEKLDLRQISDNVVTELRSLQNEAAIDYLKIESETYELLGEIENADNILSELESVLKNFRDGLSDVKNEMTFLQEKSLNMNISLNNRKNLSKTFASFIENVMLEPTLIDEILTGAIDDKYVENIKRLCKKLEYIKKYNLMDNLCVREIEPELTKLKIKACERIRAFILEEVSMLKKPKTNIQLIQQNRLIKYKMLLLFLKDHSQPIFFEIVQVYSDTLNKIYNHNLSIYINELNRLVETRFAKNHTIMPISAELARSNVFELGNRQEVVEDVNQQPIIAHVAQKNNQMFPVEALFKSLNRLLVETVGQEYSFCQIFFSLNDEQAAVLFAGIFKQTIQNVLNRIRAWLSSSMDPYTPLLISTINAKSKDKFNQKGYDILDYYFDQVNFAVWPRFTEIYDSYIAPLTNPNYQQVVGIETEVGLDQYYSCICSFLRGMHQCSLYSKDNQMINYRISRLIELLNKFVASLSDLERTSKEKKIAAIKRLSIVQRETGHANALSDQDKHTLEKELELHVTTLVEEMLGQYFTSLVEFAKKGKDAETNLDAHDLGIIERISKEFNDTWISKLGSLKAECEQKLGKTQTTKRLLKRIINNILELYTNFFNCVKSSYPSFTQNMLPLHKLSIEIKNQINSLE